MIKKEQKGMIVTCLLIAILCGISSMILKNAYQYYGGPEYKVDCYIRYLNERAYDKLYPLLSEESIKNIGSKQEIEQYYKKIYEKENKLVSVTKLNHKQTTYMLQYQYTKKMIRDKIIVIKEKGSWKIKFPFEAVDVEIFAPLGATVYIDSHILSYHQNEGKYEMKNLLPGTYLLKVIFNQEGYNDYYKMIKIPENQYYELPYTTAHVKIDCAPNLKVSLGKFNKQTTGKKAEFNDILLNHYLVKVEDEKGNFKTQKKEINIVQGKNSFKLNHFDLTDKGKKRLENFVQDFYNVYIESIAKHDSSALKNYFIGRDKQQQIQFFNEWYIDLKDIKQVKMHLNIGESQIDETGQIHLDIRETAELYNKEYDKIKEQDVTKCYKVILDFETVINVLEADWKITDRRLLQSLVAVQDQEGRWVQY